MSRCRFCRELLSEGEECDCPGVEMEAECAILRQHLDFLTNPIQERKPKRPVDLVQLIREDREARAARILAYRKGSTEKVRPSLKKPSPLPQSVHLQGEGPTAADQLLKDRDWPEGYLESFGPVGEDFPTIEEITPHQNTLADVQKALPPSGKKRRLGEVRFSPAKRKALLKLDPFDLGTLCRVIRSGEAYQEVLEAVRLQARETCAKLALQASRGRSLAGDESGADVARKIAKFIRENANLDEGF